MTDPAAPRSLGNFKQLLEPFDISFEQGLAEIPDNVQRSGESIARIKVAAKEGREQIDGFVKSCAGQEKAMAKDLKRYRREMKWVRNRYRLSLMALRLRSWGLELRLFWARYKNAILALIILAVLAYLLITFSDDLVRIYKDISNWLFAEDEPEQAFLVAPVPSIMRLGV
nr:hypothetical protein [uncultured Cohaesibacter sp.]